VVPLVSITLFLPLAGAILLVAWRDPTPRTAHCIGLIVSGLALLGAIGLWARGVGATFTQVEEVRWIPSLGAAYRVGVDGISAPLALMTAALFVAALAFSVSITERTRSYVALFLLLETACLGVFLALDLVLFYVFWEVSLVAMYFIIAGWGHNPLERQRAALTFFLYTLLGSLPLLLAIIALYLGGTPRTFDMRAIIAAPPLTGMTAGLTFVALLIAFAVKTPLFPLHTWLPLAHTEAPTAGSAVLAGVLLKLGTYGFIRLALQMTPGAFRAAAPYVAALAVVSALYGAFVSLAQTDLKRMVAYTSVNHMGYVVLAIAAAAANQSARALAIDGAVLQMVSHGIVTGVLFLLVGTLQDRAETREMAAFGGLLRVVPVIGWGFILAAFASLGLPGLAHFPAEFQIFLGTFQVWPVAAAFAVLGIVITAGLYLRAIQTTFLGGVAERWQQMPDLTAHERWAIVPLLILVVLIGVAPGGILAVIHRAAQVIGV